MWEHGTRGVALAYYPVIAAALDVDPRRVAGLVAGGPRVRLDGIQLPGLAAQRRAAGLTGRALASAVGVAPSTLSMWETAGVPTPRAVAERIAEILECTPTALREHNPDPAAAEDPRPLRRYRRDARMSRAEAAIHLGVHATTLARYEAGVRATPVALLRHMARIYGQPTSALLATKNDPLPQLPARPWTAADLPHLIHARVCVTA
jgi:transcriptional regulator with XRE-family HTH domain